MMICGVKERLPPLLPRKKRRQQRQKRVFLLSRGKERRFIRRRGMGGHLFRIHGGSRGHSQKIHRLACFFR